MSKELLIDECKKLCRELRLSRLENLIPTMHNFSDFDGPSPHECENDIRFVFGVFKNLDENRAWGEISWYALKSLGQRLREISNLASQCHSSRDQAIYESFALGLDSFVHELRASGISFLSEGGANIERASVALSLEMEKVIKARDNFEKLQDEVRMLITPVVAGSLSQSFAARKRVLFLTRMVWGVISIIVGYFSIYFTIQVANYIAGLFLDSKALESKIELLWPSIFVRSIILLPFYVAFGFSFSQYKKERDFEEEYAHKAAVATSLPNYGDLTREPAIRDQIVMGATNVIFSSPISKVCESERQDKVLGGIKEVFDSLSKLIPKKD